MRIALACLVTLLLAAVAAPSALAQSRCVAPPGSSAVDEYCEVVPDGTGGTGGGGSPGGSSGAGGVPGGAASQLERSGPTGDAVLSLAGGRRESQRESNKDETKRKDGGARATKPRPDQAQLPDQDQGRSGNNVVEAAAASTSEATRVGSGFIWVLLASVVAVGGWGWIAYRRRTRATGPTDADGDGPSDA